MSGILSVGGAGNVGASGSFYSYSIDQSLRFNDGDSPFLKRDITTTSNAKTWTWSAWVKRSSVSTRGFLFSDGKSSAISELEFQSNGTLYAQVFDGSAGRYKVSTQVFRDASAWYHIVWRVDTTQATAADRNRVYINGEQITDWSTENHPTQNADTTINVSGNDHIVGAYSTGSNNFDGYMAEVHFVDGTSLDPTSFGEEVNGVWRPVEYSGSYGTNGFYLPFAQDVSSGSSAFFSDSGNSYVQFADASLYDIGSSDDFTIEFFFNPTASAINDYQYLFGNYVGTSGPYMSVQSDLRSSQKMFYLYYGNGAAYSFGPATDDFVAGQWYHVAINRVSGNLRFFLDGTQLGSTQTSNTQSWNNNDVRIGQGQSASTNGFDGYMSNARMVVGSAVYADGASITVPTATLTDVTNTKLLALTTSTITQDASSNSVTGTLSGSGYFSSELSPFADFNFYDDTSGNGNNFTVNNLVASDVVPDSPTNNFATWNSIDKYNYNAPSEGNLRALTAGNNGTQAATFAVSSGKWYFEVRNGSAGSATVNRFVGVGKEETNIQTIPYSNADCYLYYSGNGYAYNGGSSTAYGDAWQANGDIIGVAFDADNGAIWFSKNGTWQNSATAAEIAAGTTTNAAFTGLSGTFVMMVSKTGGTSSNDPHDANFGQDSTFSGLETAGGNADGNGYGDFAYAPPSGFLALCSANLPEPAIGPNSNTTSDQHFNTVLWTGNGSTQSITGVGFSPDFVWNKARSTAQRHALWDTVRGATKILNSDATDAETTSSGLTSFDADGWTTGSSYNQSGYTFASWNWKAGGTAVSNTDGSITSSVSANPDAGFSIVGYTGTGSSGTYGHGLGVAPNMIMTKDRTDPAAWAVYVSDIGTGKYLELDQTDATTTAAAIYPSVSSTTIGVGVQGDGSITNTSGDNYISYCFANVEGFSKVGSYVGNGNADGTFVYTGFRPAFVLVKASGLVENWYMYDAKRNEYNVVDLELNPNSSQAEQTFVTLDFVSNGFKVRTSNSAFNTSGQNYLYLAIGEAPAKYSNAR